MSRKLTIEEIKSRLKYINPNIEILSEEYIGKDEKLECKCIVDGCHYNFKTRWNNLRNGNGCPKCFGKIKLTLNDIIIRMNIINTNIKILSDKYINSSDKLKCKCLIQGCEHEWYVAWANLSNGRGCPKCANKSRADKQKHSMEYIKSILSAVNQSVDILDNNYTNSNAKLKVKCLIDGTEWYARFATLRKGHGCPECAKIGVKNLKLAERNKGEWLNKSAIVYVIECRNENEIFYKIGITKKTTYKRFLSNKKMPYDYTILKEIHTNLYNATYLENKLHALNKEFAYTPQIKFAGYTECFSNLHSFDIEKEMC